MHNIYRIDENVNWDRYTRIVFPDGQVMDEDTHDFERDGFFWSDEEPLEYKLWKLEQDNQAVHDLAKTELEKEGDNVTIDL